MRPLHRALARTSAMYGVDWFVWRIVISPHINESLTTIEREWSLGQLVQAHVVLDSIDALTPDPEVPKK